MLIARVRAWIADEDGAVTVDWVVLSAAIAGLGIASVSAVRTGTSVLGTGIQTSLSGASVADLGALGAGNGETATAFDPVGCAGDMDGVRAYAAEMYDSGAWSSGEFDYDYEDMDQIIEEYRSYDNAGVAAQRDIWANDYETRPEAFESISNMVEMAVAQCVASERGV